MGKVDSKMRWKDTVKGIPQGAIMSPLMSNLYLHPFDGFMVEKRFGYVRYADDFIILSFTEGEAYRALKDTKWFLEKKLKLNLNLGSIVKKVQEGFEFLGILFKGDNVSLMETLAREARHIHDRDMETLRGKLFSIEGRASSCYWELIEKMLNEDIEFEGRIRQGATDLVNSLLNYGYGILYSRIWQAALKAGLNPYISYLHKPQDGKPTLVFDLIEEFRQQAVDRAVFSLITKGENLEISKGLLTDGTRKRVAEKVLERIHAVEIFRGKEMRLSQVMREQAKAVTEFLEGKITHYRPYIGKW